MYQSIDKPCLKTHNISCSLTKILIQSLNGGGLASYFLAIGQFVKCEPLKHFMLEKLEWGHVSVVQQNNLDVAESFFNSRQLSVAPSKCQHLSIKRKRSVDYQ